MCGQHLIAVSRNFVSEPYESKGNLCWLDWLAWRVCSRPDTHGNLGLHNFIDPWTQRGTASMLLHEWIPMKAHTCVSIAVCLIHIIPRGTDGCIFTHHEPALCHLEHRQLIWCVSSDLHVNLNKKPRFRPDVEKQSKGERERPLIGINENIEGVR